MPDYVSGAEFKRWTDEEANFRQRLEKRLSDNHASVHVELSEIKGLVRETNGRVGSAERTIAVIERELSAIKSEENDIEETVDSIKQDGCNQYAAHVAILESGGIPAVAATGQRIDLSTLLTRRQKVAAGAGLSVAMAPAVVELVKGLMALLNWLLTHTHLGPQS